MDYKFLKGALSSTYGMYANDITDVGNMNPETMKTGLEIGSILNRIDETKQNVSRETKELYMWNNDDGTRRMNCDNDGNIILELTNPLVCNNYDYFEGVCISECTWCDNPYHCKYKNVSRETCFTAHEIAIIIIATDFCWNNFECGSYCDDNCIHNVSSDMTAIALTMIKGGEY